MNISEIAKTVQMQKEFFLSHKTKEKSFRIENLKKLKKAIKSYEKEIIKALNDDLKKSEFEAYTTEIGIVLEEINFHLKHLSAWMKPVKVKTPITYFPSKSYVMQEPFGVVLILAPWNYPFQLVMAPLIGAITAGNCVVVKPSEISSNASMIIHKIISETFSPEYVASFTGGKEINQALLNEKYDYIFFTGGPVFGKIVMKSAAENLTPITLELGGKSPTIVAKDANISIAAKRIVWGKFVNAGQTCIAPDYVLADEKIYDTLLMFIKEYIKAFFGDCNQCSSDFARIITDSHFDRLASFIEKDHVFAGGIINKDDRYISPTILTNVSMDSPVMQEEIFGPILPVIKYQTLNEACAFINSRPKPLALYLFTEKAETEKEVLTNISFGGGCVNDTLMHVTNPYMPFGGVGSSGMGGYHGKKSFETFSHMKSIFKSVSWFDLPVRYAPYKNKVKIIKRIMH